MTKIKSFFKSSLVYSLGSLGRRFVGVLLVPVYTRVFSPGQYGIVDIIATLTTFLSVAVILGMDSALGRYYADASDSEDKKLTASTALAYTFFASLAASSLLLAFAWPLAQAIFQTPAYANYLIAAFLSVPAAVLFAFFQNFLRWRFQATAFAVISISSLMVQIGLTIYLLVFLKIGIIGIYIAAIISQGLFALVGFWFTRDSYVWHFSYPRLKQLINFGAPLVVLSLAYYSVIYADRYFLKYFRSLHEVGLYGAAHNLACLINLTVIGFQNAWGPFVYSTYKDQDAGQVFARIYNYISVGVTLAVLAFSLFAREILTLIATSQYAPAYPVVPLVAAGTAIYAIGAYFAIGIGIAKKNIHKVWIGLLAAGLNLLLNYLLVPRFGMVGAALATVLSFLTLACLSMIISQRYYRVNYRFLANGIMYLTAAVFIFIGVRFLSREISFLAVGLKLVLLAVFLTAPFMLKLIGRRELKVLSRFLAGGLKFRSL